MAETPNEFEPTPEAAIDLRLVVGRLQEFGVVVEIEDFDDKDPDDILGDIATYAVMYDFDIDDILREVTPIESRTGKDASPIATLGDKENEI